MYNINMMYDIDIITYQLIDIIMNIYNSGLVHIKSLPCLRLVAASNTKAETTSCIDVILCQIA